MAVTQPGVKAIVDLLLSQMCFCKAWDAEQQVGLLKAPRLQNTQSWVLTMAAGALACPAGHRSFGRSSLAHLWACSVTSPYKETQLIERLSAIMGSKWKPRILLKSLPKTYFSFYKWANIFECKSGIKRLILMWGWSHSSCSWNSKIMEYVLYTSLACLQTTQWRCFSMSS